MEKFDGPVLRKHPKPANPEDVRTKYSKSKKLMPPESVVEGIEKFTNDLYKCAAKETERNFVISGLSAHMAMSLCALGAEGDTAEEMRKVLHHPKSNTYESYKELVDFFRHLTRVTVTIMNKVCADNSIIVKESFKKDLNSLFYTKLEEADFSKDVEEIVRSINDFCAKATENKIKEIISIDNITTDTRLLLINAIHFKANWSDPFGSCFTTPRPFHINEKVTVDVPTMTSHSHFGYKDLKDLNAHCVALFYEGYDDMFLVICPYDINGLKDLEINIENVRFNYKEDFGFGNQRDIILFLPKFKIENGVPIKDYLDKLGMVQAFSTTEANFKGISEKPTLIPPLYVDEVFQKVLIEVNEKGTEAAAVTYLKLRGGGYPTEPPPPPYEFKVDRPFLFRIVNLTKNVTLFSGRIVIPEYSKNVN